MTRPYPWKCRTCHEKAVYPATVDYSVDMEHDGRVVHVKVDGLQVLRCGNCNTQQLPDKSEARLFDELRRKVGLLMPSEIAAERSQLKLSQKDFAQLLGVAAETVCRWESGVQIQQRVMNDFMRAFFALPALREFLRLYRGGKLEPEPAAPATPG